MYGFIQKYGKQIMAVFSVFLMIAFAYTGKYGAGATSRNPVIARLGTDKIYNSELAQARASWDLLKKLPYRQTERQTLMQAHRLGPDAFLAINQHPIMFLLLRKEAQRMGVSANNDILQTEGVR